MSPTSTQSASQPLQSPTQCRLASLTRSVKLAQQGHLEAFTRLVNDTKNLVTSTALAITLDIQASEDVAQQAYIDAWQQMNQLQSPESFLPWLRQITRNKAKNYLRDNKVDRTESVADTRLLERGHSDITVPSPEATLAQQQVEEALLKLVAELPAEHRDLLILYYREQQNSRQVSALMDLSEANVRQTLSRLRAGLKHALVQQLGEGIASTAPGIVFTASVTAAIASSLPTSVAAATLTTTSLTQTTFAGWLTKIAALLSGALAGGVAAITAIVLASSIMGRNLSDAQQKRFVKHYCRGQVLWVLIGMTAFALSYELTVGWHAPVVVYSVFLLGMGVQQFKLVRYFRESCPGQLHKNQIWGWAGLFGGALVGFASTLVGLMQSGRLPTAFILV